MIGTLFPRKARQFISSSEESTQRETLETQADLAAIYSAQPVNAPEKCNVNLRLAIIEQYISQPSIQARLQNDEEFSKALSVYMQQLQFQAQQNQNAIIGRIGTAPASGLANETI